MAGDTAFLAGMMARTTVFHTKLPRAECVRRLKAESDGYFSLFGPKPARAMVFDSMAFLVSPKILANHAPVTVGLKDEDGGTRVSVRTGPLTTVMVAVVLLGLLSTLVYGGGLAAALPAALVLIALGAAVVAFTAFFTAKPHAELRAFVETLLEKQA